VAWEPWAAVGCFVAAVVAIVIGVVLTTRWLLDDQIHPLLHDIGLVLLIIGIPLVILGGHFMDLSEKKAERLKLLLVLCVLWLAPHNVHAQTSFAEDTTSQEQQTQTLASEYIFSTERVDAMGKPRALMMSWQAPARWTLSDRWSLSFRPEVFWDRDGRWTLAKQTVKAFTTTLEYRPPYKWSNAIFRLEHRFDDSRGPIRSKETERCWT